MKMFRTKEEAKKELQEKILILDSNYKLALVGQDIIEIKTSIKLDQ